MNLKTKLTLSTVMLASYANVAVAEFYEAPFLAPRHCDGKLIQGHKNAGGFYLSESCNTVFVRPPDIGVAEYTIGSVEVNDQACDDYQQGLATIRKGQMQKDKLTELISNPNAKKADIEKWSMQRDLVQQAMNDADASLDKSAAWAGLKASVRFQSNAATEVQKYQQDNLLLLTQGARFQEVDIRESYLSFPQISGEAPQRAQMVVAVNSPGIEVRGLKSSPGSASAALKGAKSIAISFGMNAICNLRRAETEKQRQLRGNLKYQASVHDLKFAPADMEANFPVVLTYSVAVQSGYKYKASLDYNLMLDQSMKFFEHRPDQFTLDAFTSEFIDNDTNNAIKWEFEALPQAQGTKEAE
ncbi:MAG TPA: hypothetical protein PKC28_11710, partial [Bdellovibrionales bacterium]|nr:hypothetical protein [Bdellovibrionales bacterium]